ncbi:methyl-accepting chemotaxis protein [Chromobacterium phragmitis]|uniref:Methyl-accepting chemotaxis protein n=1 Tax=Chromobacterium phragmitis TaxID=2202141 RepID=A0A344UM34_9NEIS|nr:methyl-accepting chemotaxis protein [Chromobacterium phragmitis]AXE30936.1 methyl-accepting chemotaxis protein [Chromobacterium phragmitis]AXE36332.1 methyl-accepting chemotaxis protein [Chromobacterium phragmitis]
MLHQLTVRQKLLGGFSLLILLLCIVVGIAYTKLQIIQDNVSQIKDDRYPKIELSNRMALNLMSMGREMGEGILAGTPQAIEQHIQKVEALRAKMRADMDNMEPYLRQPEGRALFAKIRAAQEVQRPLFDPLYALIRGRQIEAARAFLDDKFGPANDGYIASLEALRDRQQGRLRNSLAITYDSSRQAVAILLGTALVSLLVAMGVALAISNLITTPLRRSADLVHQIKEGDLSGLNEPIPAARDEAMLIARDIQEMREGLRLMVQSIQDNAHQVSDSARALSGMAQQVANGAQTQAEATTSAAASIEQLTVSINQVADNSSEASEQAQAAGQLANRGGHEVLESVGKIRFVTTSVDETSKQMNSLTKEVQQIGNIVTVIRDVADQTNLLALNAAIEAARAGEMGRGFAVVADEVRKLAERTTSSAQEITTMIASIQQGVGQVVHSMGQSLNCVEGVSGTAEQASNSMREIESSADSIMRTIHGITGALTEQRSTSLSLAQDMEKVSKMAEENNATVQELATTSSQLSTLSANLQSVATRFRL